MEKLLTNYGIWGIIIGGLAFFIILIMKWHYKERKEWKEDLDKLFKRQDETLRQSTESVYQASKETTAAYRETSNILTGLKTLLENQNRK